MTNCNAKKETRKCVCYIENGSIYLNNGSDAIIREPALLFCANDEDGTCTLIRYGEAESLRQEMMKKAETYSKAGLGRLSIIECNPNQMTLQEQCYVLRRAIEYSSSPFIGDLFRRLNNDPGNVLEWLHSEMARVPIDI